MRPIIWTLLVSTLVLCVRGEFLMGGHLDNKHIVQISDDTAPSSHLVIAKSAEDHDMDLIAEESGNIASTTYPDQEPRYKIPYAFAFNGGKPFSLEKDPITGKIDFEKAPPLKALNFSETYKDKEENEDDTIVSPNDDTARIDKDQSYGKISYLDSKRVVSTNSKNERIGPNEINPYSPSFHDFLNLPVKYSSEKYERENYPLISSSYANTKVQSGSNSYNINNHKPYHQDTVTKTSVNTSIRKVYYPKSTSTTTTTTTTSRMPETTSTTMTTRTTTALKPVEKKTTTLKSTKPPTTTLSTAKTTVSIASSSTSSPQPKVTTWKPAKSTSRYDEYEDMLPIEKLTSTKFSMYPMGEKEQNGHNNGPQGPTRVTTYDYSDGYDDYESSLEEQQPMQPNDHNHHHHHHHRHHQQHQQSQQNTHSVDIVQSIELESPSMSTTTTTASSMASPVPTSPSLSPSSFQPTSIVHLTTSKPMSEQPATSMPLDNGSNHIHVPPVHENVIESHRPADFFANNNNNNAVEHGSVYFPNGMYGRPGSVISVLPESTSNVIVPHNQDTVSFVLGNRQNVEGSYYTHGSAMEERPSVINSNENNFSPIFGSQSSNIQQSMKDQKVSVALPSISVVDSSITAGYNTQPWYNQPGSMSQSPVKPSMMPESDTQNTRTQSSVIFPLMPDNSSTNNNNVPALQQKGEVQVSSYVSFPDNKNKQDNVHDEQKLNSNQSPVEEHIIVINQADGTIKEITPNGHSNPIENTVIFSGSVNNNNNNENINNNNNNPNLPQLSESLTPPAARPLPGSIGQRPPYYFHYQHGPAGLNAAKPPGEFPPRPQRLPLPLRPKPADLTPVGFKKRPNQSHDAKLPNILPQFRPNAKTSHGHRGTDKIGTLPAPLQPYTPSRPLRPISTQPQPPHLHPSRRPQQHHGPISVPPPHLQRLNPPPPPPPPSLGSIPPNHPSHPSHHHQHGPPSRKKDELIFENLKRYGRPASGSPPVRPVVQKHRMEDEMTGDRFSAEPPQIPPRPIIFPKNRIDSQMPKVATLQMIQQRGGFDEDIMKSNLPPLFKINKDDRNEENEDDNSTLSNEADRRKDEPEHDKNDVAGASEGGPVYVVYPVNSAVNIGSQEDMVERDESVVIGTRGPHMPLPPDTLPHDDDDDDDEGKHDNNKLPNIFFGKRPHHNSVNSNFGAPGYRDSPVLVQEKPILIPSDELEEEQKKEASAGSDSSFNVISYLQDIFPFGKKAQTATISATLPLLPLGQSSSPIAYVYTPTTPPSIHRYSHDDKEAEDEEDAVLRPDRKDEKPVLLPSQQPSSSSSSAPSPQNFMAPFVASVSAEMPAKNGWSVVVAPSPQQVNGTERTKNESRKEVQNKQDEHMNASQENEAQTEKSDIAANNEGFDPDKFKPQLFGGFKPIYEFPVEEEENPMLSGRAALSRTNVNVNAKSGRKMTQ